MALTLGTKLGRYEVLAPLGAGGTSEVYRAKDTRLDREVAIEDGRGYVYSYFRELSKLFVPSGVTR